MSRDDKRAQGVRSRYGGSNPAFFAAACGYFGSPGFGPKLLSFQLIWFLSVWLNRILVTSLETDAT